MPETVTQIRDDIDNYKQTVGSILALANTLMHESGFQSIIGKTLVTSQNNLISKNTEVTPDLVSKKENFGIITEVKKCFPNDRSLWINDLKQIQKYDDELSGWNGRTVTNHDIIIMTHISRSRPLSDVLTENLRNHAISFNRKVSIVEFDRNSERELYFFLRLFHGSLSDSQINTKLAEGIQVPSKYLIMKLAKIKFYDSEPHVVYTMSMLWDNYISQKPTEEERRAVAKRNKTIMIPINLDDAHMQMKEQFGPDLAENFQCQVPKKDWIKRALDKFVELKHAKKIDDFNYEIKFRRYNNMDDSIEYFANAFASQTQTDLPAFINNANSP